MSDYYDDQPETTEAVAVDDRLVLMQQYVDLDAKNKHLEREQKRLAEQVHKVHAQMREIHKRLDTMLGFEDPMAAAKKSLDAEVQRAYGGAR